MKWLPACAAVIVLVTLSSAVSPAVPGTARRCNIQSPRVTAAIIDGDLWGMIQSQRGRYLFTSSGDPVLDLEEAAHLTRMSGSAARTSRSLGSS
jgi:hypothetical protein